MTLKDLPSHFYHTRPTAADRGARRATGRGGKRLGCAHRAASPTPTMGPVTFFSPVCLFEWQEQTWPGRFVVLTLKDLPSHHFYHTLPTAAAKGARWATGCGGRQLGCAHCTASPTSKWGQLLSLVLFVCLNGRSKLCQDNLSS